MKAKDIEEGKKYIFKKDQYGSIAGTPEADNEARYKVVRKGIGNYRVGTIVTVVSHIGQFCWCLGRCKGLILLQAMDSSDLQELKDLKERE